MYKFVNDIKEGSVYSIENLAVAPNVGSFRTNRHAWKLMFQFTSKVQIMGGDRVHGEAYELVPISQLTVPNVDTDYLVGEFLICTANVVEFLNIKFIMVVDAY